MKGLLSKLIWSAVLFGAIATDLGNFKLVMVSNSKVFQGAKQTVSKVINGRESARFSRLLCSTLCMQIDWCNLWCADRVAETCHFFDMYLVAGYQEENMSDALKCYTRKIIDYVVGAAITGAPVFADMPDRLIGPLVDGIYTNQASECYFGGDEYNPYIMLDIGSAKPINQILIVLQPNNVVKKFYDFEARVGLEEKTEAYFSEYQFFGKFDGPSSPGQEIFFKKDPPIMARYIIIRRWSSSSDCPPARGVNYYCMMQLCHIEIA